ncbi:spore germination protein [Paenibacillus lautus]|uniref:spore germination protein n=2 Tax=Bacilli TaxID=91061 RepID=UPI0020422F95|nr:spore germination protein [Paenibacillus lautus]MCM3257369.1 spore germination protein [Paenibacillus lautus]
MISNIKYGGGADADMNLNESLAEYFKANADYFNVEIRLLQYRVQVIGLDSLVDIPQSIASLQTQTSNLTEIALAPADLLKIVGELVEPKLEVVVPDIMKGHLIILEPASGACSAVLPISKTVTRSVTSPETENTLYGSSSAFLEDINTNIGILRKHCTGSSLQVETYTVGKSHPKSLLLIYQKDKIKPRLLQSIQAKIKAEMDQDVHHIQQLEKMLGVNTWSLVTNFNMTELPQNAAHSLQQGKAVLMLDRYPFAIIIPSLVMDMFCMKDDHNSPLPFMYLIRILRVVGVLIATIIPGLYVALVSVNPEVLRLQLALSIANSRQEVPYPAFVETLLLLIVLELILEASVRLPKSVGPTITMVGGIILGQAAVSAKLVSNLLIIVLAGTTIASSTVVGFQNSVSVRVFKYMLIILSAIYGMLGLLAGIVVICAYMGHQKSMGIPYLSLPTLNQKDERNG